VHEEFAMPHAKDIFADALDVDAAARDAFVRSRCGDDDTLALEVLDLLRVHDSSADFLHSPTINAIRSTSTDEHVGDTIGPYTLEALIGEGGFGRVYRASQHQPLVRTVALKIIKLGMDTRRVTQRFEAERQTLARLDHPNIATIFDAGATPSGRPYFVMELVEGEPLTDFAQRTRMSLDARLRLFITICRAVQHSHQRGVIHRDLKPANVLVCDATGGPLAKIIDFGIAKCTQDAAGGTLTIDGPFMGTPEYASPEQAAGDASAIDTRSDVYALGVMLYELLAGVTPRAAATWGCVSYAALQSLIAAHEPLAPSTLLRQREPDSAVIPRLRGPLDWITLRAIANAPAQRYQSAAELADDIERAMTHQPVIAAPPSTRYRLWTFTRRNRVAVALGALALTGILATSIGTTYGLLQARSQEQRAQEQLARANAVAHVLKDSLASITPEVALGRDTTLLREVLAKAEASVSDAAVPQPDIVQIEIRTAIANVYKQLGDYPRAIAVARPAYTLAHTALADDDSLWNALSGALAESLGRDESFNFGSPARLEAVAIFEEALARARRHHPAASVPVAVAMSDLGWAHFMNHRFDLAVPMLRDALRTYDQAPAPDLAARTNSLWIYVNICTDLGMLDEAIAGMTRLRSDFMKLPEVNPSRDLLLEKDLADLLRKAARYQEARPIFVDVIPRIRSLFGDSHRTTTEVLYKAAMNEMQSGDDRVAFGLFSQAHAAAVGDTAQQDDARNIEGMLVETVYDEQSAQAAEPIARAMLDEARAKHPGDNAIVSNRLSRLGSLYLRLGKYEQALHLGEESLAMRERMTRMTSTDKASSMILIANAHLALGQRELAQQWAQRARTIMLERTPEGSQFRRAADDLLQRIAHAQAEASPSASPTP
jgi:eukaryotic-like serine/threonine-protein kinase